MSVCHCFRGEPPSQARFPEATVLERLDRWAAERGDQAWLTAVDRAGVEHRLSFGEIQNRSLQFAGWLGREHGVVAGDIIALTPRNDLPSVVAILGAMRAGCEIFFLNWAEPKARLAELIAALPVRLLLSADVAEVPGVAFGRLPDPADLIGAPQPPPAVRAEDGAFYFSTSGSTAAAKLVRQAHFNVAANAEALRRHHGLDSSQRLLGCLPIHHVNGLHFTIMATLWAGAEAVLIEAFEPALYRHCLARHAPTLASVVPSILERLRLEPSSLRLPPGFRYFVSAAAPLNRETARAVLDRFGARVLQGYGLSETTNFSCTMPDGLTELAYRRHMVEAEIPSVGVAVFGNEVAILRPDGELAAPGEVGEICMRGHNVMLGYAGNAEATREAFADGWFHSGDLGCVRLDPDTGQAFFVITGRLKNVAKVMGVSVSLEEIERALALMPKLIDAACFTKPDRLLGEAVIAVIAAQEGVTAAALDAHLAERLPPEMRPVSYIFVDEVPRTGTGKLLRQDLKRRFSTTGAFAPVT